MSEQPHDDRLDDDRLDDDDEDDDEEDDDVDRREGEDGEHGFPVIGHLNGEPIPALNLIPHERWYDVMAPLRRRTRRAAINGVTFKDVTRALALVGELDLVDAEASFAAVNAPPPAPPAGSPPSRDRSSHQINFRLGPDQYARLVRAAGLYGLRPATLARVMTVSGVDRALLEERRAREQERSRWRR